MSEEGKVVSTNSREIRESAEDRDRLFQHLQAFVDQASSILGVKLAYVALFEPPLGPLFVETARFSEIDRETRKAFHAVSEQLRNAREVESGRIQGDLRPIDQQQPSAGQQYFWIGAPLFNDKGDVRGAFWAAKYGSRGWANLKKSNLRFLTSLVSGVFEHRRSLPGPEACDDKAAESAENSAEFETRFDGLSPSIPAAIFSYIRGSGRPDEIRSISPGCINIWGYTQKELENDPSLIWTAVFPEDLPALRASIQQSGYDMTHWQHRWRIRDKSGLPKWLQAYGSPHRNPDGSVTWSTLILDVTVEQQAQITLAANTRLLHEAQRLESIGRLAGGVAHDFNNLLSVIMGNAEAISPAELDNDAAESIHEIIEAAQRGAVLVKQLLSFARKSDLRESSANIRAVLTDADRLLRRVLPSNISLQIIQRADLWPVQIDRAMFENALLNLVINARDAMPEGGALTIETSNAVIDSDYVESREEDAKPGKYVMVAITDTGPGIDESSLPYVFEPFFSTKGANDGSGLGLAMVQGFVKQSAGIVRIYSELGHGTSIKMYFPADECVESSKDRENFIAPQFKATPKKILLVEDQDAVRRTIEKLLTSAGYQVTIANSGDEAFALYTGIHSEIDIIVTDVVMPGKIQGPQFVRLARKINNAIPVLYLSGYPHEANVHGNGIRSGDISLMKPIRRSELLTALSRLGSRT